MEQFYNKLRAVGASYVVTIPKQVVELNGWELGDPLEITVKAIANTQAKGRRHKK